MIRLVNQVRGQHGLARVRVSSALAAIGQRRGGASTVVRMWMESPPHRAVLLSSGFRRIGIARRWGILVGSSRAVVTADFASRR